MMRSVPVTLAQSLRNEGLAWRDVAQEIAWATGRRFTFDAVASACRRSRLRAIDAESTKWDERANS